MTGRTRFKDFLDNLGQQTLLITLLQRSVFKWVQFGVRDAAGPTGANPRPALRGRKSNAAGLAVAVGIGYFLAARLSLFLLAKPDGVAVFWPAAGISSGILIAFGREVRWPVAIGTMAATIVANLH